MNNKSKGLGDSIEKFTKATGIKKAVDAVAKATNTDCGCGKRRDTLNRIFSFTIVTGKIFRLNHQDL